MPLSDSSQTYMRAVWPKPSPAVLRLTFAAGVSEVSRFSRLKFLGVPGVFDYAGLSRSSRYRACSCCLPRITRASASGLHLFGAEYPPHLSSVYASLNTSRYPAQDSRPSGSLLLSREALSSSASCRFIPAHRNGDITSGMQSLQFDAGARSVSRMRFTWLRSKVCAFPPIRTSTCMPLTETKSPV